ncbi:aminopeptidase N [Stappia taiwanensis]|uniref:Aminopeptidase N n=1 Tax=Stappia taiwanensis TaxID=992267 RepID=A0A838XHT3_9HYPH|nr:aminopeptidase N [Stappia taiwanensis]MBA4610949.1 aminopeptidase N [Stappia taiwanensis]GGE94548.1 aminopeptidase N [Stappia taiwanensis]
MRPDTPAPVRLEDYRPTDFAIDTVSLDIRLAPKATQVRARLAIRRRDTAAKGAPLVLDGDELDLVSLALDGRPLAADAYTAAPDRLEIRALPDGPFVLEIETRLDPDANTKLMGLYRSSGTYCTQCEAEGFRRITYFLDRPDCLSVYTTRIEARESDAPVLLGNGNPVEAGRIEGTDRHYAVWHDPHPKPAYLFAMVAGDLARVSNRFTTADGRDVALNIYVEHGNEGACDWAMDSLKRSMRWDEEVFGRIYDLEVFNIVAVSDFNMGAMENKGLNIFNDKYVLASPDTATDQDYAGIEAVIAHEYFHNWTGNRITCRDWFQLCLKEGLTVFRDQEFSSDMRSRPVKRIADVRLLKSHQFPEDAGPLAHPVRPRLYHEINNFYTATVYEKGAEVVRMLKALLGPEDFRAGMDLFFERHDGEATTVEAFLACFQEASGRDLAQFSLWYEQAGTPTLTVDSKYEPEARRFTMTVRQSVPPTPKQSAKKPMTIPLKAALIGPDGTEMTGLSVAGAEMTGDTLHIRNPSHMIVFSDVPARPVPSLLREFSAPVHLKSDLSDADLLFLAARDTDPFNRWQALQSVALSALIKATQAAAGQRPITVDPELVDAIGASIADDSLDPAFRALCLQLPGETDLAREIGKDVDPEAICQARRQVRATIADRLAETMLATYTAMTSPGPFSPDAAASGRRALRNVLLEYLSHGTGGQDGTLARAHFDAADNMTDRAAALGVLVHARLPGHEEALAAFADRHGHTPLALDKWFTIQATAPFGDALDTVKRLTTHAGFSMGNPNRVRALIGAFATGNQSQFNRADGAGFDYLAEVVLSLDKTNPQVAARLASAFRSWRSLEPERQARAEAALRHVAAMAELSPDVRDIVDRCLQ